MSLTLRSKTAIASDRPHITETRRPGSREQFVGANGEFNANNNREVIQTLATILDLKNQGKLDITPLKQNTVTASEERTARREELIASYFDPTNQRWAELGAAMAGEVSMTADREGFSRKFLSKQDISDGQEPRIRVRYKNVVAIYAAGIGRLYPQLVRDNYIRPQEFYIKANIRVEEREIRQGPGDILEDKYYEAQEHIIVVEDRIWKSMADASVGVANDLTTLAGGLNPNTLAILRDQVARWGLPTSTLLMAHNVTNDLLGNNFVTWFDPVKRYELLSGSLGNILGMEIISDAYREPNLRVLNPGEIYVISSPEFHGAYTDRGPVTSTPVDSYPDGVPARGWSMYELISMVIHNPRSVAKGVKIS